MATQGMRALPIGTPKVMVSTMASGDTRPYVGPSDICMMYSVTGRAGHQPHQREGARQRPPTRWPGMIAHPAPASDTTRPALA